MTSCLNTMLGNGINKMPATGILLKKESLVQYSDPVLMSSLEASQTDIVCDRYVEENINPRVPSSLTETLDSIIPPREWEENGNRWRQCVSCEPANREAVIRLCKQLDMNLEKQEARHFGICPVRRSLMNQCFDEIIRQVTVDSCDRGLLLLRVRDEMKKSLDTYMTVFENSVVISIHKAVEAEQRLVDTTARIAQEQELRLFLERELSGLKSTFKCLVRDLESQLEVERSKNSQEIDFLKKTNKQLKVQYEGIVIIKK